MTDNLDLLNDNSSDFRDRQFQITRGFADAKGFFGEFGGYEADPETTATLSQYTDEYVEIRDSEEFMRALASLHRHWLGRPTPIYHAKKLSQALGGAQIYLKREDLAHTGLHKVNHCLGEALLAKSMKKRRIVSETAGSHGICLASAAACVGIACEVFIGSNDWASRRQDIVKMRMMGAKVTKVATGSMNLKEAADMAFDEFIKDADNTFYACSTIAGPQPFPNIVKDLQAVVGEEAKEQIQKLTGRLPHHVCGCVAGGSNALGIFQSFLIDDEVKLHAVDHELPSENAVNLANPGAEFMKSFTMLRDINYVAASPKESAASFLLLAKHEGIMPNWEACAALTQAIRLAPTCPEDHIILVSLSGRAEASDVAKAEAFGAQSFKDDDDDDEPNAAP